MANTGIFIFILVAYISSICALACCKLDKKVPVNYILLAIFTFCVSWMVGFACMVSKGPLTVLMAATITAAMTIGLTLYAMYTKTDFTMCGGALWVFGMIFLTASIFAVCIGGPTMNLGISVIGVFLFSFYLIYDT